jgi:hypothetical protein
MIKQVLLSYATKTRIVEHIIDVDSGTTGLKVIKPTQLTQKPQDIFQVLMFVGDEEALDVIIHNHGDTYKATRHFEDGDNAESVAVHQLMPNGMQRVIVINRADPEVTYISAETQAKSLSVLGEGVRDIYTATLDPMTVRGSWCSPSKKSIQLKATDFRMLCLPMTKWSTMLDQFDEGVPEPIFKRASLHSDAPTEGRAEFLHYQVSNDELVKYALHYLLTEIIAHSKTFYTVYRPVDKANWVTDFVDDDFTVWDHPNIRKETVTLAENADAMEALHDFDTTNQMPASLLNLLPTLTCDLKKVMHYTAIISFYREQAVITLQKLRKDSTVYVIKASKDEAFSLPLSDFAVISKHRCKSHTEFMDALTGTPLSVGEMMNKGYDAVWCHFIPPYEYVVEIIYIGRKNSPALYRITRIMGGDSWVCESKKSLAPSGEHIWGIPNKNQTRVDLLHNNCDTPINIKQMAGGFMSPNNWDKFLNSAKTICPVIQADVEAGIGDGEWNRLDVINEVRGDKV